MSKMRVKLLLGNRSTKDSERAILPTLIFAKESEYPVTVWGIVLGWWAWGIGFMVTTVEENK